MIITDLVQRQIFERIACHEPERGGALYGPRGYPAVTHFEFDPEAETSSVSYIPSSRLIHNVANVERGTGLQFKGIVHSHPRGYSCPSPGDERTAQSFFRLNPHFAQMAMPIVQQASTLADGEDGAFMTWYTVERRAQPRAPASPPPRQDWGMQESPRRFGSAWDELPVQVIPDTCHVIRLGHDVGRILESLRSQGMVLTASERVQSLQIGNAQMVGLTCSDGGALEFMYFVTLDYPVVGPTVLYQDQGNTRSLRVMWDGLEQYEASVDCVGPMLARYMQ